MIGWKNLIKNIIIYRKIMKERKIKLINKKELITKFVEPHKQDEFKKWNTNKLRAHFCITHKIDGEYKNMSGYCFKCLTPLRPDFIQYENYCKDC